MRLALLLLAFLTLNVLMAEEVKTPYMIAVDKTMSTWPYELKYHVPNYMPTDAERIYRAKSAVRALFLPDPPVDLEDPARDAAFKIRNNISKVDLLQYLWDIDVVEDKLNNLVDAMAKSGDPFYRPHAVEVIRVWRMRKLIP